MHMYACPSIPQHILAYSYRCSIFLINHALPTTHLTIADHHSHRCTLVPGSTAKKQGKQTPRNISHTHQLSSTRLNQPNKTAVLKHPCVAFCDSADLLLV